jgi:hypothetical protein
VLELHESVKIPSLWAFFMTQQPVANRRLETQSGGVNSGQCVPHEEFPDIHRENHGQSVEGHHLDRVTRHQTSEWGQATEQSWMVGDDS